jgi:type IV pilus assembly protein PilQ
MIINAHLRAVLLLSAITLLWLAPAADLARAQTKSGNRVTGVGWQQVGDSFLVTVRSDSPLTYTAYELINPLRVVLDVADASLADSAGLPKRVSQGPVSEITGRMIDEQEPFITRIELILSEDRAYVVERADSSIVVKFAATPVTAKPEKKETPAAARPPAAQSSKSARQAASFIDDVIVTTEAGTTRVLLKAAGPIQGHRHAQLPKGSGLPHRLYIDIPDVRMKDNARQIHVGKALARIRMAHRGTGVRVVFDSGLERLFDYEIDSSPQGLLITIADAALPPRNGKSTPAGSTTASEMIAPPPEIPAAVSPVAESKPQPVDSFAFAGYNNQKISVDFFKIDLHNVFRLIGEISGSNIVVDEGVSGTLTLALTEVPWDFVLDVVLNLKSLQKEERFNTIVISPKDKEFHWPKRATDQLTVKADGKVQESITVKKRIETSPGIMEATRLVNQGNEKYRVGDYAAALPLYEEAFAKWPENKELAERIAAMSLIHLGMNSKAVHYAKAVLTLDPQSGDAALHAAIGLANMKRTEEAKKYFDKAVAGNRPASEALLSYAAFCEENGSHQAALDLLHRHAQLYGDSLDSMVARARIYDKQGRSDEATRQYREILLSGFEIPADLKRYINGRIELATRR